jgi:hypothetical protein
MRQADVWNYLQRMQRFSMAADRPCASALPLLLGKSLTEAQQQRVQNTFVIGLTHAIDEVRWYTAWGVANQLWSIDRELALRCVNALATEATLVDRARRAKEGRPYDQRRQIDEMAAEAASVVRQRFWQPGAIAGDAYETLDVTE